MRGGGLLLFLFLVRLLLLSLSKPRSEGGSAAQLPQQASWTLPVSPSLVVSCLSVYLLSSCPFFLVFVFLCVHVAAPAIIS